MVQDMIHLIYGSDDNYWFPTAVSAASAAWGTSRPLTIHLFDLGVSDSHYSEYVQLINRANASVISERHVIDKRMFSGFGEWRGSIATYSRMFVQDILPDLDWAIYVDGDTLWLGDISKLWALRDETKLIQASADPPMPLGEKHPDDDWYVENGIEMSRDGYLCMGLMMVNLKAMREEKISEKCREFMAKYPRPRIVDQTVLNCVCRGSMAALPPEWGVFSVWHGQIDMTQDACVHYVNDLPWRRDKLNRLISDVVMLWYEFTQKVLGLNLRHEYLTVFSWWWRRGLFCLLKHLQWVVGVHPYVKSRLRNTHGIRGDVFRLICSRWTRSTEGKI